ncbi:hypothetical protein [uncultured Psychroserpens sp.]|uniref:hypothetical protein n=1 Tax=uncultured Psychroserpens sp. TaxID=255436 RepID=UPI002635742A|nr:hypothetical protein [uncultured Psychroserpens sp.]
MQISFTMNDSEPNSILLVKATSADGIVTNYNAKPILTNTFHSFEAGGSAPWEVELSGYYVGPKLKVANNSDLIAAYKDTAFVCTRA